MSGATGGGTGSGGLANLRDAGAPLRPGALYRSDAPAAGDAAPADLEWPPRTVVDLREPGERGERHPLAGPRTRVVTLPMQSALEPGRPLGDCDLPELYVAALDRANRWLPTLVAEAARAPAPLLVHCTAGKDRTGIAVAVLLRLAGAARAHVTDDFLRTAPVLDEVHRRLRRVAPDRPVPAPRHTVVDRAAIEALLDALGEPDAARELAFRRGVDAADLVRLWRM